MAYIKARPNGGFLITVSCGRDAQDHKISKSVTFRPDPCTAKGHLKSENTIQREVKEYAAAFEKKVLLGQCIEGDSLTLEKYSERYLRDYATITQAPRTLENTRTSIKQFNNDFGYMVLKNLNPLFLQEYVNRLLVSPKGNGRPGTISQNTVKRKMAVLSAIPFPGGALEFDSLKPYGEGTDQDFPEESRRETGAMFHTGRGRNLFGSAGKSFGISV